MRTPPRPAATGEFPVDPSGAFVYRAYTTGGALLYVGYTDDLARRLTGHRRERSPWINDATRVTWEFYPRAADALLAERRAIENEHPKWNVSHNHARIKADRMGHRQLYPPASWQRLGELIKLRRGYGKYSQTKIARAAGTDLATVRAIEAGETLLYDRAALEGIERALDWRPGSVEVVLAGGEPTPLSAEDRSERALATAARMRLGDRL
jgi:transcriptional regulator with XRE-family HTH domain/predicted GIY-YIG superfamily endonuclease